MGQECYVEVHNRCYVCWERCDIWVVKGVCVGRKECVTREGIGLKDNMWGS